MKSNISRHHQHRMALAVGVLAFFPIAVIAQQSAPAVPAATAPAAAGASINYETRFPSIAPAKWTGARLSDGQPDIQGHWSNTIANHNNFEDPGGGSPGERRTANSRPLPPREERAPSRVSDPADGKVPFQPWAAAKVEEFKKYFSNPIRPEFIEPLARCAPAGVPKSLYWHGYEIRQYPGYLVFLFDSGTRVIHLDGKPHLPSNIKLWNADSRGHWEGNTLVVEVRNNNAKALFGRTGEFASDNVLITERYIFDNSNKRYNYVATVTDPTVYTQPFTVTIPARRWTLEDKYSGWHFSGKPANHDGKEALIDRHERICSENNGGFGVVAVAAKK